MFSMKPAVHLKPDPVNDMDYTRLNKLWAGNLRVRDMTIFTTLDSILSDHESFQKDLSDEDRAEFLLKGYEKFFVQLSWSDLPYRKKTMELLLAHAPIHTNPLVSAFMSQFAEIDSDKETAFIYPQSYAYQYFIVQEVCRKAKRIVVLNNLFPDQDEIQYMAVFSKENMEDILLLHHIIYTADANEIFGGYKIYGNTLPYYLDHLCYKDTVLRSPWLPDRLTKYQSGLSWHHNPAKILRVRREIDHILAMGWFKDELEFFHALAIDIMPLFGWWYDDIDAYETKDHFRCDWRLRRMEIRSKLTAEGILHPKWKHELSLFLAARRLYPDTLYQYRPDWLQLQSLDIYIPSLSAAIEYQGVQHYQPVDFFGGQEALAKRQELDQKKAQACKDNNVTLIIWNYDTDPTEANLKKKLREAGL